MSKLHPWIKDALKQASDKLKVLRPVIREGSLDEVVHDLKSSEASNINNSGVQAQIDYILQSCGLERTVEILEEAKSADE
jgi:hypothetical protein